MEHSLVEIPRRAFLIESSVGLNPAATLLPKQTCRRADQSEAWWESLPTLLGACGVALGD